MANKGLVKSHFDIARPVDARSERNRRTIRNHLDFDRSVLGTQPIVRLARRCPRAQTPGWRVGPLRHNRNWDFAKPLRSNVCLPNACAGVMVLPFSYPYRGFCPPARAWLGGWAFPANQSFLVTRLPNNGYSFRVIYQGVNT